MSKPIVVWYEENKNITDPRKLYLDEKFDVKVISSYNKDTLKIISSYSPKMLILDCLMKNKPTGMQLYRELREKNNQDYVCIFLTIWASEKDVVEEIRALEIPDYLILDKDITIESFAERVEELYRMKVKESGIDEQSK